MIDIATIAQACGKARMTPRGSFVCLCPAHGDSQPSLQVCIIRIARKEGLGIIAPGFPESKTRRHNDREIRNIACTRLEFRGIWANIERYQPYRSVAVNMDGLIGSGTEPCQLVVEVCNILSSINGKFVSTVWYPLRQRS